MRFSRTEDFEVLDLGQADYATTNEQMDLFVQESAESNGPDRLILAEFNPVLTVGRAESVSSYKQSKLSVFEVPRGGKATYHGPGQLVAYPIIRLEEGVRDLHAFLSALEVALIATVGDFGLEGDKDSRNTGCWVAGRKIASIGIAVRRWVTYHGLALNVSTDLEKFRRFDPCGLDPELMTSLEIELGHAPPLIEVKESLVMRLSQSIGRLTV